MEGNNDGGGESRVADKHLRNSQTDDWPYNN